MERGPTWAMACDALADSTGSLTATRHSTRALEQPQRAGMISQGEARHAWKMRRDGERLDSEEAKKTKMPNTSH